MSVELIKAENREKARELKNPLSNSIHGVSYI
ncbi:Uncharacterised protein [Bacillus tequilensis]|nr:Uncharacterised protein [Bacillus tequilensis]